MDKERYQIFYCNAKDPEVFHPLNGKYSALNQAIRECSSLNNDHESGTIIHMVLDQQTLEEVYRRGWIKKKE